MRSFEFPSAFSCKISLQRFRCLSEITKSELERDAISTIISITVLLKFNKINFLYYKFLLRNLYLKLFNLEVRCLLKQAWTQLLLSRQYGRSIVLSPRCFTPSKKAKELKIRFKEQSICSEVHTNSPCNKNVSLLSITTEKYFPFFWLQ